jgi:alpha-glucosidase
MRMLARFAQAARDDRLCRTLTLLGVLAGLVLAAGWAAPARAQQAHQPQAREGAIVTAGNARFTVLTDRLVRMEWDDDRSFEDRASLVFIDRRQPVPDFTTRRTGDTLRIDTGALQLAYAPAGGRFDSTNLRVQFDVAGVTRTWRPGMENEGNLMGTARTLDGVDGRTELDKGILSRDGWAVVDDSNRPLFDDSDWPWAVGRADSTQQDWYFFGYGHDYKQALRDYTEVAGDIPMPPRFAFGLWWSRYWAYTDQGLMDLVRQYDRHDTPLDVLVVDMDWHNTFELRWDDLEKDQAGQWKGWTGYTWNDTYFPDPEAFLDWTEERNLKVPLNLHPASGIQPWEEQYPAMARAMGIDPSTDEYVPFDIVDKRFARNYFDIVIDPLEEQGVDFWWLDWQQWSTTDIDGVTPTWWLNYVFFTEMKREGEARPLIFHRWGGMGNHRYQIGFSGDHHSNWKSLRFQPYFTATASNVGYGYWSHDIGGHTPGPISGELYTRWMQFGVFSPIVRTHMTKNPDAYRRFWKYDYRHSRALREAVNLRYRMIPYIYSMARHTYDTGVSLLRPLYYRHPEQDAAYTHPNEYYFGEDLLVAPITDSLSADSMLVERELWLPEGEWIGWFTGRRWSGGQEVSPTYALDEVPVFVQPGAVIPMQEAPTGERGMRHDATGLDPLVLTAFPGGSDTTRVYQDPGNGLAYQDDAYAWTTVRHRATGDRSLRLTVEPMEGSYPGRPETRAYTVRLPRAWPPDSVTVTGSDGGSRTLSFDRDTSTVGWHYEGSKFTAVLRLPRFATDERVTIDVTFPAPVDSPLLDGMRAKTARLHRAMDTFNQLWKADWTPESMIDLYQTGRRIELMPDRARTELETFRDELPAVMEELPQLEGDDPVIRRGINHLHSLRDADE